MALPPYMDRDEVHRRLLTIFPEGTPNRSYCTRELAASTVFAMLYIGAVEGADIFLAPKHVYRMGDKQAANRAAEERATYRRAVMKPGNRPSGTTWYADNTREPIRDETLREGLLQVGAAAGRTDLSTTSSKGRYYLKREFSALFDPHLTGDELANAMDEWRKNNLSRTALMRVALAQQAATASDSNVRVRLPNGGSQTLAPGPSSLITKAVVEQFASRFLKNPAVLWLSESGSKVIVQFDELASRLGFAIPTDRDLPDLILADVSDDPFLILFVEIVATDGAVSPRRKEALTRIAAEAGLRAEDLCFLTAYADRDSPGFKKTISNVAWDSYIWFAQEPEQLLVLVDGTAQAAGKLADWRLRPDPS